MVQAAERPTTTPLNESGAEKSLIDTIHDTLLEAMRADERIVVLGEDVGRRGGVFRVTAGFLDEFGEARVIDTPIAESGIIGSAIGMAINGLRPVAEIQFLDFIHSAMDQIMNEAARIRYRSNNDFSCPIVIRVPFGGGIHGALYHSQSIEAMFVHTPGLKVVAPATPADAKGLLTSALRDEDPVLYLEHKKMYRLIKGPVPDGEHIVPIGKARVAQDGRDATIITYGMMVYESVSAAETVAAETGASIEVIDLRSLKPLDEAAVLESARKTGKVLVVTEANSLCSVASEVAAIVGEHAFAHLDAPVMRVAAPDVPAMPFSPPLEKAFLVDAEKIGAALRRLVAY
jgi:2-oxoisovalerate dehydrogenase E1 component beta subunit